MAPPADDASEEPAGLGFDRFATDGWEFMSDLFDLGPSGIGGGPSSPSCGARAHLAALMLDGTTVQDPHGRPPELLVRG